MTNSKSTPKTDAIAQDLRKVVADVLDLGYPQSGTLCDGRYIEVNLFTEFIEVRIALRGNRGK